MSNIYFTVQHCDKTLKPFSFLHFLFPLCKRYEKGKIYHKNDILRKSPYPLRAISALYVLTILWTHFHSLPFNTVAENVRSTPARACHDVMLWLNATTSKFMLHHLNRKPSEAVCYVPWQQLFISLPDTSLKGRQWCTWALSTNLGWSFDQLARWFSLWSWYILESRLAVSFSGIFM